MARPQKDKAVVIARFSALGDVTLTVPALYDLCRANPDTRFVMVTRRRMAALFAEAPPNLTVEGIDLDLCKGVASMYRLARQLRSKYIVTAFVDLHDVLRTKLLRAFMRLGGVPVTVIDKGRRDKKRLVEMGSQAFRAAGNGPLETTVDRYRRTFERAGFDVPHAFRRLFDDVEPEKNTVGIAPFAAHPGKVYPPDLMEKVVAALAENPGCRIFLFGAGGDERRTLAAWADGRPNVTNVADLDLGIGGELRLMASLRVMVAMDSANMHMAAVAGTPHVVSVWGATHPDAGFVPPRFNPDDAVGVPLPCRPCSVYGNRECKFGDYRCLRSITPRTIVQKVNRILNS